MTTYTIASAFARYRALVLAPDAPAVQVLETQRAFVAGIYQILMFLRDVIGGDMPEEEGMVILEGIKAECEAFGRAHAETPPPDQSVSDVAIELGSIYGMRTHQGLVEMTWNGVKTQMDLDKAREVVGMMQQAIEAAATDQMLVEFLTTKVGLPLERAVLALGDFREMRQGSRDTVHPS